MGRYLLDNFRVLLEPNTMLDTKQTLDIQINCFIRVRCALKIRSFQTVYVKESEVAESCPTLCDPVDCSPPGSSVHGILQARGLEWVPFAI